MDNNKTTGELLIDKFHEFTSENITSVEALKETLEAYNNVLKGLLDERMFIASHLEISDEILQKEFEQTGKIANEVLAKSNATINKMPLILQNQDEKYLALFTSQEEIKKNTNTGVNCAEVIYTTEAYEAVVKNEYFNGIVINPFGLEFIIDNEHLEYLLKGCPEEEFQMDLEKVLAELKSN